MTEVTELESQSTALTKQAAGFPAIQTADHYVEAAELMQILTGLSKTVEEYWAPVKKTAHATWKGIVEREKEMLLPLTGAVELLKIKIKVYRDEQELLRQEQERLATEAAAAQQQEQALLEAEQLESAGQSEAAERVLSDAQTAQAPVVIIPSALPTVKGVSFRGAWKYQITNEALIPREYLKVDEQKIGAVVRAMKNKANIPGVKVYLDTGVASRS